MKVFIIFFLFLFFSCTPNKVINVKKINYDEDIGLEEFKSKIMNYGKNSDFPNIK